MTQVKLDKRLSKAFDRFTSELVWGCIWLNNGTRIELDGDKTVEHIRALVGSHSITSFGQHEIGEEAHVYLTPSEEVFDTLTGVNALLRGN